MTKNTGWKPILLTALALATLPAALLYTDHAISNLPEPEKQAAEVSIPRVSTLSVSAGRHQSEMRAFGEVRALDEIGLSSQVSGRVVWRNPAFVVGGRLRKDEALIRIDDTDYQLALANAKQALAEAALTLQQEEHQQQQAQQDWRRSGIKDKPSSLLLREPQLRAAGARYQAARVAVTQAKRDLEQTQLRAPFDAVVVQRQVGAGSYLSQGGPVATLRNSSMAEIHLALSASQWQQLHSDSLGSEVTLSSRDYPGVTWQGKVQRLSEIVDQDTRLRSLIINVEQPLDQPQPLRFGSFVSARIQGAALDNLFPLPASALTADGYIWYLRDDQLQRARRSPVFSAEDQVFVQRGELPERIELVRKPMASYLSGMKVEPVSEGANR